MIYRFKRGGYMKVIDLIKSNSEDVSVILKGANPYDSFDGFRDWYFEGNIKEIPDIYHYCYVLFFGMLPLSNRLIIDIPYFKR